MEFKKLSMPMPEEKVPAQAPKDTLDVHIHLSESEDPRTIHVGLTTAHNESLGDNIVFYLQGEERKNFDELLTRLINFYSGLK